jgi:tetratricopeptide (TPR) repeat protein
MKNHNFGTLLSLLQQMNAMKRKFWFAGMLLLLVSKMQAQSLKEAQSAIDNENYRKARQLLGKMLSDPAASKPEIYYLSGNAYFKDEDPDSAMMFYKLAFNPESKNATGFVAAGRIALLQGKKEEAVAQFDKAVAVSKQKNAEVYFLIGDAWFSTAKDWKESIRFFESAYRLDPKNTSNLLMLGDAYLKSGEAGKAMSKYEEAIEADKNLTMAYVRKGRLSVNGRMYDAAIEAYQNAIKNNPNYALSYKELGEAYYLTRQFDKVAPEFKKYISLNTEDLDAKTKYAAFLYQNKEYEKVISEVNGMIKTDPENYVLYRMLAFANFELKRYKDGYEAVQRFWALPNKKVKPIDYVYAARLAAQMNDTIAAYGYFTSALEKDSSNCDLLGEYAKTLFTGKRYAASVEQYNRKKAACGSLSSLDVFYLGRAYLSTENYIMADTTFAEFITRNATSPDGYYWRARTNMSLVTETNKYPALPYYMKFIELASTDATRNKKNLIVAYSFAGSYYLETNDMGMAKNYFNKALELDPENKDLQEILKQTK